MREIVGVILAVFGVYLAVGALTALPMVFVWAKRFDPSAGGESTIGFRLLALPGAALLWPLLVIKLLRGQPRSSASDRVRVRGSLRLQLAAWLVLGPVAMGLLAWGALS